MHVDAVVDYLLRLVSLGGLTSTRRYTSVDAAYNAVGAGRAVLANDKYLSSNSLAVWEWLTLDVALGIGGIAAGVAIFLLQLHLNKNVEKVIRDMGKRNDARKRLWLGDAMGILDAIALHYETIVLKSRYYLEHPDKRDDDKLFNEIFTHVSVISHMHIPTLKESLDRTADLFNDQELPRQIMQVVRDTETFYRVDSTRKAGLLQPDNLQKNTIEYLDRVVTVLRDLVKKLETERPQSGNDYHAFGRAI